MVLKNKKILKKVTILRYRSNAQVGILVHLGGPFFLAHGGGKSP
jgi:hypothetical protein